VSAEPPAPRSAPVTWDEIAAQPPAPADHRLAYGEGPQQFGELRLPQGPGPHPVVVLLHGGCWRAAYDLGHVAPVGAALAREGYAVWTPEYRRLGDEGGGWPGTFEDVSRATEHLRTLAVQFPLDLGRVALMGHSAGGHLALWLAAREKLPEGSALKGRGAPLPVRGVVALAAISDLAEYARGSGSCNKATPELMGGTPEDVAERYAQASPLALLPLGVPVRLVHGAADPIVPVELSRRYAERAREGGDDARVVALEQAGHFDVVAPFAPAWGAVLQATSALLRPAK
jgi:acetyl esterase/lipase